MTQHLPDATVTLTVLHVTPGHRYRALASMASAPGQLKHVPGLQWCRYMGCGRGPAFSVLPDWSRYALLASWQNPTAAQRFWQPYAHGDGFNGFATQSLTFWLAPTQARGAWGGCDPLPGTTNFADHAPVAVLTRAHVRWQALPRFWRASSQATAALAHAPGLLYSLGAGTNPLTELCTFSLWADTNHMRQYAYGAAQHSQAVRQTRAHDWFREEYFARFAVRGVSGNHALVPQLATALMPEQFPWGMAA